MRYNNNPSAVGSALSSIGDSIMGYLADREAKKRQAMLDEMLMRKTNADIEGAAADRQLRVDEAIANRGERADDRAYTRSRDVAADAVAADERSYSRGRDTAADAVAADERTYSRGRDTVADTRADRQFAHTVANDNAQLGISRGQLAVAQQNANTNAAEAGTKLATAKAKATTEANQGQEAAQSALMQINRLLDANDVGGNIGAATGAYEMRGFTQGAQDFNGVLDQVVAALTLPNLGTLKGPMSDKDVVFVKQLATRLGREPGKSLKLSEGETRRALMEAQALLQGKAAPAGPAPGTTRTINGIPAVWDGRGWKRAQ